MDLPLRLYGEVTPKSLSSYGYEIQPSENV